MNTLYPPHLCPRCGQPNGCAQAGCAEPASDCWCFQVRIDPVAIAELPAETREQACLCVQCAQVHTDSAENT
ncbi:cysteine-rich CWC family protein [Pseudomonas duriflava]|uniref:cysteine-rich CWC family protein n=1 Tax=Pseudomonas duriflava TaxID=459528 RepID=UPI00119F01BC|nr:cysteine-rich CWC family protein [Pseudomonas duriflava]